MLKQINHSKIANRNVITLVCYIAPVAICEVLAPESKRQKLCDMIGYFAVSCLHYECNKFQILQQTILC